MVSDHTKAMFEIMQSPQTAEQTRFAFLSVMTAKERVDFRDRVVEHMEPHHRLCVLDWRRRGVVLPYGATHDNMTFPNRWLFTETGILCFRDSASPLSGWE